MTSESPLWMTSSDGRRAETSPADLAVLGEHAAQCTARSGRLVALRCGASRVQGFVASRLVTTLALLVALTGWALLAWL